MRLKTYTAPTIAQAMEMIRKDLGDEAIIVSTQGERGRQGARVTAAIEEREVADTPLSAPPQSPTEAPLPFSGRIAEALAFHGLPTALIAHLDAEAARYAEEGPELALSAALDGLLTFQPLCERSARPLMLIGAPGGGKTLTAAKLIVRGHCSGRPVRAVSTDGSRAGGIEQLEAFTRILKIPLVTADGPEALAAATAAAQRDSLLVIDTAGVNLFHLPSLQALRELARIADAEPVLVLAAGGDIAEAVEMAEQAASVGCRRMIATRVDIVRRLGAMICAAEATGLAFADVGASADVNAGLLPLNPVSLARLLLRQAGDEPPSSFADRKASR